MADTKTVDVQPATQEQASPAEHKAAKDNADQMFGNAAAHTQAPKRLDIDSDATTSQGAPAQGPNVSTEQKEFVAANEDNKKSDDVPEEEKPAPQQASNMPVVEAGKEHKAHPHSKKH